MTVAGEAGEEGGSGATDSPGAVPALGPINAYCRGRIDGFEELVTISAIGEGFSNPTFLVTSGSGRRLVLRAMPQHLSAASAHRIDREYKVITALQATDVPVPRPVLFCADPGPAGSPFYLMSYVQGTVYANGALPAAEGARRRIFLDLARCLGRLHATDYRGIGLSTYGRGPGSAHFQRRVSAMSQLYRDTELSREPLMETLIEKLAGMSPAAHRTCLIHGDYRLGNVVIDPELDAVAAILDWELSTLGDPMMDVGYCTLMYHWASPAFGTVIGAGAGVPTEEDFLAAYCEEAGERQLPDLSPYQALCLLRLACITQAALHREAHGVALPRPLPAGHLPGEVASLALDLMTRARR